MEHYDRQGQPITFARWAQLHRDDAYHRIAYTEISDEVTVSTVWLGLDHGWGTGPMLIFETMVFGGPHDQDQWRYTTEVQALAGHDQAVALERDHART